MGEIPNALPELFGREESAEQLANAVRSGRLSILVGPRGIGKTSLLCEVVRKKFPRRLKRTIYTELRPGDDASIALLRDLAGHESELATFSWPELMRDRTALHTTLIRTAEDLRAIIVVENMQYDIGDGGSALMNAVRRYATRSGWIFTSHQAPQAAELQTFVQHLEPLSDEACQVLAQNVRPGWDLNERVQVVKNSHGNPWVLRRLLALKPGAGIVQCLEESSSLLAALAQFEYPISDRVLEPVVSQGELDHLIDAGLIIRRGGLLLHDAARDLVEQSAVKTPHHLLATMLERVLAGEASRSKLDAYRISLAVLRKPKWASDVFNDEDFTTRYAPKLWALICRYGVPDNAQHLRYRVAARVGDPTAGQKLPPPVSTSFEVTVNWLEILSQAGMYDDLLEYADQHPNQEGASRSLQFRFALACATAYVRHQDHASAIASLRCVTPSSDDAWRATYYGALVTLCFAGMDSGVDEAYEQLEEAIAQHTGAFDSQARFWIGAGLYLSAKLHRALSFFDDRGGSSFREVAIGLMRAHCLVDLGRFAEARQELDSWRHYIGEEGPLCLYLAHAEMHLAEACGPISESVYAVILKDQSLRGLRMKARVDNVIGARPCATIDELPSPTTVNAWSVFCQQLLGIFQEEVDISEELLLPLRNVNDIFAPEASAALAVHALSRGDMEAAHAFITQAVGAAEKSEWVSEQLYAARWELFVLGYSADRDALRLKAMQLAQRCAKLEAPLVRLEAEFFLSVLSEDFLNLERIARAHLLSPRASRLARLAFGEDVEAFRLEKRLVSNLCRHTNWPCIITRGNVRSGQSCWGIDRRNRRVWIEPDHWIDLSTRERMWWLLDILATTNGPVKTSDIAATMWPEESWHAIRHGDRIKHLVSQLRSKLRVKGRDQSVVVTGEGAITLREPLRVIGVEPQS